MNYSSRFWLFAPLVMLLALAVWVGLQWWTIAGAMDKSLTALNGHEAAPGITISYAKKTISGFPFNVDVVFDNLKVEGQGAHGPFQWTAEHFALHRLTYGPAQDIYEAAGNQSLSWTDGGSGRHAIKFLPGSLRASSAINARGIARFDLEMVAAGGSDTDGNAFTAAHGQFHFRRNPDKDQMDLQVSGDDITMDGGIKPFGGHIKSLSLSLTLTEGSAFAPLLTGKEKWSTVSDDWRARGGRVSIGPVAVASEKFSLTANAVPGDTAGLRTVLDSLY